MPHIDMGTEYRRSNDLYEKLMYRNLYQYQLPLLRINHNAFLLCTLERVVHYGTDATRPFCAEVSKE